MAFCINPEITKLNQKLQDSQLSEPQKQQLSCQLTSLRTPVNLYLTRQMEHRTALVVALVIKVAMDNLFRIADSKSFWMPYLTIRILGFVLDTLAFKWGNIISAWNVPFESSIRMNRAMRTLTDKVDDIILSETTAVEKAAHIDNSIKTTEEVFNNEANYANHPVMYLLAAYTGALTANLCQTWLIATFGLTAITTITTVLSVSLMTTQTAHAARELMHHYRAPNFAS